MSQNLRELDFHLLLTFDTIQRFGSVTRAAQHLGLTQGAVSHSLKRLRELFDDPLFIRSKDGFVLTERGSELGQPITDILARAQELVANRICFDPERSARTITLGLNAAGELAVLPSLIKRIRSDAPGCSVASRNLALPEAVSALENGEVDLILSGAFTSPGDLLQQKLYTHGYAVIVSRNNPLPAEISLQEYCALEHASSRPHLTTRGPLDEYIASKGLTRRIIAMTDNMLVLPRLVEDDPGLAAVVPYFMTDYCVRSANVRVVRVVGGFPTFDVFQIWHRRYDRDNFSRWLRSAVSGAFLRNPAFNLH